jgi:hypothetical protein
VGSGIRGSAVSRVRSPLGAVELRGSAGSRISLLARSDRPLQHRMGINKCPGPGCLAVSATGESPWPCRGVEAPDGRREVDRSMRPVSGEFTPRRVAGRDDQHPCWVTRPSVGVGALVGLASHYRPSQRGFLLKILDPQSKGATFSVVRRIFYFHL